MAENIIRVGDTSGSALRIAFDLTSEFDLSDKSPVDRVITRIKLGRILYGPVHRAKEPDYEALRKEMESILKA